jgi:hypothetical protein
MKLTVDDDFGMTQLVAVDDCKELAWLEDDRVKRSHHPSGLCHFSESGTFSGANDGGRLKGIGDKT